MFVFIDILAEIRSFMSSGKLVLNTSRLLSIYACTKPAKIQIRNLCKTFFLPAKVQITKVQITSKKCIFRTHLLR